MIRKYCDKCGEEVESWKGIVELSEFVDEKNQMFNDGINPQIRAELCAQCYNNLFQKFKKDD